MVIPDDVQAVLPAVARHRLRTAQRRRQCTSRGHHPPCSGRCHPLTVTSPAPSATFSSAGAATATSPIILAQRRIFIVPTRAGLLFALALVVMLLGAINYNLAARSRAGLPARRRPG